MQRDFVQLLQQSLLNAMPEIDGVELGDASLISNVWREQDLERKELLKEHRHLPHPKIRKELLKTRVDSQRST